MFNLLPDNLKNKIISEYKFRRVIIILLFILFVQVSALVFSLPSWLVSFYKEKDLKIQIEKTNQKALSSNASQIKDKIKTINNQVTYLDTSLQYPELSPYVDFILSQKTPSLKINSFNYINGGKNWTLTIRGIADSRESLVAFTDSLKSNADFKSVELPVSNLAKNKNIDFSVIITISN